MQPDNTRNTLIFIVAALALFMVYDFLVLRPANQKAQQQAKVEAAQKQGATTVAGAPGAPPAAVQATRQQAAAASPRVEIDTPSLKGSIALKGARIDDLYLKRYRQTLAPNSPLVELFRPDGARHAYWAAFGWTGGANLPGMPDRDTVWTAPAGAKLTTQTPLTLTYNTPQGLRFTRTIAVDKDYMFTVTDTVANLGAAKVTIAPWGAVQRHLGPPDPTNNQIVHEGAIGVLDEGNLRLSKYKDWKKKRELGFASHGGWLGITDKYWLAALVPDQTQPIRASYRATGPKDGETFDTSYLGRYVNIAPGKQTTYSQRLFAGAKVYPVLRNYEYSQDPPKLFGLTHKHTPNAADIKDFDKAIDWGMFWFLTRPIFTALEIFYKLVGNFGLAIMALTVLVKLLFFAPANKSYESITKMKKVQPDVEKLRKRYEKDPAKQQQEMMALYQREKINPFMGCLPILIQIPVFYALYKVLSVTIEMRHAPFFGWIQDLSARDPTSIWTLFGLIPWNPAAAPMIGGFLDGPLHIGVWPLIMGFTMWLSQAMSPTTGMDKMQARILQLFPIIFTFTLTNFAAGLVIYWSWNNLLSILQQYVIMRRFKVDNPIDQIVRRLTGRAAPAVGG